MIFMACMVIGRRPGSQGIFSVIISNTYRRFLLFWPFEGHFAIPVYYTTLLIIHSLLLVYRPYIAKYMILQGKSWPVLFYVTGRLFLSH